MEASRAVIHTGGQKRVECPECDQIIFSDDPDALFKHKEERMALGDGHLLCTICKLQHRTAEAWRLHIRIKHPASQCLKCPACDMQFAQVHTLMDHIHSCSKAGSIVNYINASREKTVNFVRALDAKDKARQLRGVQFGPAPASHDFGEFLGIKNAEYDPREARVLPTKPREVKAEKRQDMVLAKFYRGDSKGPDLLEMDEPAGQLVTKTDSWSWGEALVPARTAGGQVPLPDMKPQDGRAATQHAADITTAHDDDTTTDCDPHDPNSPHFDFRRYLSFGRFKCPHGRCVKSFKTGSALAAHLRADDHGVSKFMCPMCNKRYRTISALTQHCESAKMDCSVQYSESYRIFLHQLTGGMVDVQGTHADHTPQYVVTREARQQLEIGGTSDGGRWKQIESAGPENKIEVQKREQIAAMREPRRQTKAYTEFVEGYAEEQREAKQREMLNTVTW